MPQQTFNPDVHSDIVRRAAALEREGAEKVKLQNALETMFLMSLDLPDIPQIKQTISPSGRNQAQGAMQILSQAQATFSFPVDKNDEDSRDKAEVLELWTNRVFEVAGKIRQKYVKSEAAYSAVLFGEIQASIIPMAQMVEAVRKGKDESAIKQAEFTAARTPFLFDIFDPRTGFPEYNAMGLSAHFKHIKKYAGEVIDEWGEELSGLSNSDRTKIVEYCEWWDYTWHEVWIWGSDPIFQGNNLFSTIPIVSQIVDGSMLHAMGKEKIQPFLYAMEKGKLWERDSLILTSFMNNTFSIGNNPTFVYEANQEGKKMNVDWTIPGGVITITSGEKFGQVAKQVIDPSLMQSRNLLKELIEQSTIYAQSLGEPLQGNVAYSLNAMLTESGRLRLSTIQENTALALARMAEIALEMAKQGGKEVRVAGGKDFVNLKPADIPDNLVVGCTLDVTKSRNMRENAALFLQLTGGDRPAVTQEWGLEELLGVEQPRKMKAEVWEEKYADLEAQTEFMIVQQTKMAEAQMEIEKKRFALQMEQQKEMAKQQMEMQGAMQPPPGVQPGGATSPVSPLTSPPPSLAGGGGGAPPAQGMMPQQEMTGMENLMMPDQQQPGVFGGRPEGQSNANATPEDLQGLPPEVLSALAGNPGMGMKDMTMSSPMQSQAPKGKKRR